VVAVPAGAYCGRPLVPEPSVEATMPRSGVSCAQRLLFLSTVTSYFMFAFHAANGLDGSGHLSEAGIP